MRGRVSRSHPADGGAGGGIGAARRWGRKGARRRWLEEPEESESETCTSSVRTISSRTAPSEHVPSSKHGN